MQELKKKLKTAERIVILGVGSDLRGDDAAGGIIAEEIEKKKIPNISTLLGGTAPENLTGEIKRLKPSHLIIIDAAEMNEPPGTIKLIRMDQIGGFSFSTHALPMKLMVDFLLKDITCEVYFIAIQPKSLKFGATVSGEVKQAIKTVVESFTIA